jgi:hypothetical protein
MVNDTAVDLLLDTSFPSSFAGQFIDWAKEKFIEKS